MTENDKKPLNGRRIAVTRAADQSAELRAELEKAGATVLELPLIRTVADFSKEDVADMFKDLWSYEWIVFTSPNGVRYFFDLFFEEFDDIRAVGGAHFAVVGKGTAAELNRYRLRADLMPDVSTGDSLAEKLVKEQTLDNLNILIITGNRNSDSIRKILEAERAIVDSVRVYRTEPNDLSKHPGTEIFREKGADAIIFASGSAVESFVAQAVLLKTAPNAVRPFTCSIGPVTSATMREKGIPVDMEARESSVVGVVQTLCGHFSEGR